MRIGILGPLQVRADTGAPLEVSGARLRGLLILLALQPAQVVSQGRLVDALWAGKPPAGVANALQALVSRLRKVLPDGVVESQPGGYRLAVSPELVDASRFEQLAAEGREALAEDPGRAGAVLDEALTLWRGDTVEEFPADHVAEAAAARLAELRLGAVEDYADAELRLGRRRPDIGWLEALVAEHPTRERAAGLLMRALCASGRSADALAVYERVRATLADELGTDPSSELAELHVKVLRGEIGPTPAQVPTPKVTNLRAGLTSFVGRDDDVTRVRKLVGECRLTTLTGPGGSGKTRMAVESARTLVDQQPDGVWLVELAPLSSGGEIPQAILAAMGLREQVLLPRVTTRLPDRIAWSEHLDRLAQHLESSGAESIERLTGALDDKQVLLVLDNCEHLIDAVAVLVEHLLGECPRLRIVATSREPLGITGETLWPVEPLAAPSVDADASSAACYPSVRLFVDRAAAAYPGFAVDDDTAPSVVRICRSLDGMPLAIELAAARMRTMTPQQVADRLDDRFQLLATGSRTAREGHRTLRAVVDWSWELLDEAERRMLRRLAFFWGGATADAAARIADDGTGEDVLDTLTALVDKSLLILDRNGRPRYRMLETVKAYGLERLEEAGETERVRQAHATYFLELAEAAEPHIRGSDQLRWLKLLDEDRDNLHAALRGAIEARDAATAVRLAAALGWYWNLRAMRGEGVELAQEALALPGAAPDESRALVYANGGMCGVYGVLGPDESLSWLRKAADLTERTGTRHPILRLAGTMSAVTEAWFAGKEWPVPEHLAKDPDPWVRGFGLMMRGYGALFSGRNHLQGEADLEASLTAFRQSGDRGGISMALASVVDTASWRGEFAAAVRLAEEALRLVSELESVEDQAMFHAQLARVRWLLGERERSRAELDAADRYAERIGLSDVHLNVRTVGAEVSRLAGDTAGSRARLDQLARYVLDAVASNDSLTRLAIQYGYVEAALGDLEAARAWHASALEKASPSGDAMTAAPVLAGIADLASAHGDQVRAAELLGASVAVRGFEDQSLADADRVAAAARAALGETGFAEAYERGRDMDPASACELARVTLDA